MAVRFSICQLDNLKEILVSHLWGFIQGLIGWDLITHRGSLEACVPEFCPLVGPSLVGMAVETVGPALELLGLGGPDKKLFDPYSLYGKRVLVCLGKANRLVRFWWERIGIEGAYPAM